jgi:hypothetical protein
MRALNLGVGLTLLLAGGGIVAILVPGWSQAIDAAVDVNETVLGLRMLFGCGVLGILAGMGVLAKVVR